MTIQPTIADPERVPIAHASDAVLAARRAALAAARRKYARRRLVRRIDAALDDVERVNLNGGTQPPASVLKLIEEFGGKQPNTALQAHAELFRLQRRHMRTTVYEGELADHEDGDQVAAVVLTVLDGSAR